MTPDEVLAIEFYHTDDAPPEFQPDTSTEHC